MNRKYPKEKYPTESKFTLRIPIAYDNKIEEILSNEIGRKSKNSWILEAIHEKLKRK